ncbi:glycoside hydrolase family 3 C-terminal domain-containing protein [Pelagicoccus sp. SDUM812005]|uniref:glycoside hydrolase family 3 C-terminal domain-containing protein n=1 Tax=Pelagicoccus sp. SDUM812005 TaxID=3041257 RepID=UPI00280F3162|nr:glycoside hydrolase family 3 C-terminal domain-containing protein [Pelagicoccus sp. SDUM812005]MDQ8183530.1 glycoside hydrolase family 3 C-terminal domain-containing protein [Pelagicoccus sp. SDUM812005]
MIKAQFTLSGEAKHAKTLGAKDGVSPEVYEEEISGTAFQLSAPGLEPGRYRVEIGLVEAVLDDEGMRSMTIRCGPTALAKELDIVKAAGGFREILRICGEVEHLGDAQRGPLALSFEGVVQEAKFNEVCVFDEQGRLVARVRAAELADAVDPASRVVPVVSEPQVYDDPEQPLELRVKDLIRRMSLKEKIDQLVNAAGQIERLGVPGYDYWNECLHGVARNGYATVFPQATGLAAMWNAERLQEVAEVISTEARAKFNALGKVANYHRNQGLTMWSPTINIYRDPRWGRGQESYGEDPFLTARLGVAFIKGLQGDDERYLKVAACAKHYAAHSGPEPGRRSFNVEIPERDLYETYLPHFEAAVKEARVEAVMGAYNRVKCKPCNASDFLLTDLLREQWGFDGHVVADCGAIRSVYAHHKFVDTAEKAVAAAVKAGCDLDCGVTFGSLLSARNEGLVSDEEIDLALFRLLRTRFRLGMFDPAERSPWADIGLEQVDSPLHREKALQATRESLVLLKNDGVLPLDRSALKRVAVVGANADSVPVLLGNYHGDPSAPVTFLAGLQAALGADFEILYAEGCPLGMPKGKPEFDASFFEEALAMARQADVVLYFGGISGELEGEEMPVDVATFNGGDRSAIELPPVQTALLKALHGTGKPVVFVNCSGGAVAFPWEAENLPAIVQAWYPGQAGGTAVAELLLGDFNPSGKLPVTFYRSTQDLPRYYDYSMKGRTYRYFEGEALYPFGHGLSYTRFSYGTVDTSKADGRVTIRFELKNEGPRAGDEVVQLYARYVDSAIERPLRSLVAFRRCPLRAGEAERVELSFPVASLRYWDESKSDYAVEAGEIELELGASSADIRQRARLEIDG